MGDIWACYVLRVPLLYEKKKRRKTTRRCPFIFIFERPKGRKQMQAEHAANHRPAAGWRCSPQNLAERGAGDKVQSCRDPTQSLAFVKTIPLVQAGNAACLQCVCSRSNGLQYECRLRPRLNHVQSFGFGEKMVGG